MESKSFQDFLTEIVIQDDAPSSRRPASENKAAVPARRSVGTALLALFNLLAGPVCGLGLTVELSPWVDSKDRLAAFLALAAGGALFFSGACLLYGLVRNQNWIRGWAKRAQLAATGGFGLVAVLFMTSGASGDMALYGAMGNMLMVVVALPPAAASLAGFVFLHLKEAGG